MPKVELPYTEEGVKMAKELKPQVESIGGDLDFDTYDASQRSQSTEGYVHGGEVIPTYQKGGSIYKENKAFREKAAKSKVDQGKYKTTEKGFLTKEGRKQKRVDSLAAKRDKAEKGSAQWRRLQNRINKLSGVSKRHKKSKAVMKGKPTKKAPLYKSKSEKGNVSSRNIAKKGKKGLKDMAHGSAERIAEYKRRDWAMDDTTHPKKKAAKKDKTKSDRITKAVDKAMYKRGAETDIHGNVVLPHEKVKVPK